MTHRLKIGIALCMVLCLLGIGGLASAQSVQHESHHNSHHQAATHASAFCAWTCAAGHSHDVTGVPVAPVSAVLDYVEPHSFLSVYDVTPAVRSSRAPPTA
ncbi:MAG: hypothetical protein U0412_08545 [Nitrospira sp.]